MPVKDEKTEKEWQKKRKQLLPAFIAQMLTALAVLVTIYYGGYYYCDFIPLPASNDFSSKLQFALQWSTFPFAVILFYTTLQVVYKRMTSLAANPLSGKEDNLQLEKNILTNTLEQTAIALILVLALTVYLEQAEMKLVPLHVVTFVVGRTLFIIGYKISPTFRSSGSLTNIGSTFLILGLIGYFICSNGLIASANSNTGKVEL